jgi:nicotinamide mononucleotide adenylyltransferase
MTKTEKTNRKYAEFIKDCAREKTFSIKAMLSKHRLNAAILTSMRQEECIVSVSADVSNWIETHPNDVMIARIIESHRKRVEKYQLVRKNKLKAQAQLSETYAIQSVPAITEEQAVEFLKNIGGYEIYKVERKQL